MNKKIIIIEGYLAAGKSTFAVSLSRAVNVPYLIKDTFKAALCESVAVTSREEGRRFSAVTFDAMMYVTQRLMETSCPVIIEGNFVPSGIKKKDEAGVIKSLIDKYAYESLTYKFKGNTRVLYERYIERDKLPERGDANRDFDETPYDLFDLICHNLDGFSVGGEVIEVDMTDFEKVKFARLIDSARQFLHPPLPRNKLHGEPTWTK